MIKIAKGKAQNLGLDIEFEVCGMRKLSFKDKFDAVTCFFTSVNYNVTD